MNEWELTDSEIIDTDITTMDGIAETAHDAQKKLWRWLNDPCTEHRTLFERKGCPQCCAELEKELE